MTAPVKTEQKVQSCKTQMIIHTNSKVPNPTSQTSNAPSDTREKPKHAGKEARGGVDNEANEEACCGPDCG